VKRQRKVLNAIIVEHPENSLISLNMDNDGLVLGTK
jgi:hypothetical protein